MKYRIKGFKGNVVLHENVYASPAAAIPDGDYALNDAAYVALGQMGHTEPTLNERLLEFFHTNGAGSLNIDDAEAEFLVAQGMSGSVDDMWFEYLYCYDGQINDKLMAFWKAGGAPCTAVSTPTAFSLTVGFTDPDNYGFMYGFGSLNPVTLDGNTIVKLSTGDFQAGVVQLGFAGEVTPYTTVEIVMNGITATMTLDGEEYKVSNATLANYIIANNGGIVSLTLEGS